MSGLSRKLFLLISLTLAAPLQAQTFQNLVPNGSFESYTQCPTTSSQIYFAAPWTGPTTNSSDYFNSCSSSMNVPYYGGVTSAYPAFLAAQHGSAYASIWVYNNYNNQSYREYAQIELNDSLKGGACYYIEFFAANWQWVKYRTNNLAACLTTSTLPINLIAPGIIPNIQPHILAYGNPILEDTVKWQRISGLYSAVGGEKFVTIGNFKDNSNTDTINIYPKGSFPYSFLAAMSAVFIDAVSVYSIDPHGTLPWSYRDTIINKGDSVYIGNKMGGLGFHPQWYKANGGFIATNAGITVSPTITTKYFVQYTVCGVPRTDTVKVTVLSENDVSLQRELEIRSSLQLYPVPAREELILNSESSGQTTARCAILNTLGASIKIEDILFEAGNAKVTVRDLPPGVYILQLQFKTGNFNRRFVVNR